ncbi:MAG: hypothetical protein V3R77_09570, partial [Candidatus Binatia bacterium]
MIGSRLSHARSAAAGISVRLTPSALACGLAVVTVLGVTEYARATTAGPGAAHLWAGRALGFEVNRGQFDDRAAYVARGDGYQIFLTENGEA